MSVMARCMSQAACAYVRLGENRSVCYVGNYFHTDIYIYVCVYSIGTNEASSLIFVYVSARQRRQGVIQCSVYKRRRHL